jgi:hypothetical protein
MVALYTMFYNFIRIHKTLKMSPAMAAGMSDRLWSMDNSIAEMDTRAAWKTPEKGDLIVG